MPLGTAPRDTQTRITQAIARTRAVARSLPDTAQDPAEDLTAITLLHHLKAIPIVLTCDDLLIRLGSPSRAVNVLRPALHHLEALVYRADLAFEHHQRGGPPPASTWRAGITAVMAAYGLADDPDLTAELDTLDAYSLQETRIIQGTEPVDTDALHATCYSRSSHIRLLLRFGLHLADLPVNEEFLHLARHVFARDEVVADCVSFEDDVADDSFNTLRLQVRLHGVDGAAEAQEALYARILRDLDADLAQARRTALLAFANAFLPRPLAGKANRYRPTPRIPAVRRLQPLPLLRLHVRHQARTSKRLKPVPVPTPGNT
ncbi:hypothetical protein AB0D57_23000 [Streptomyces sp. NPDC048275]|uniref:hypothetical protein n=1 Tax=Streptomyces sp. NPDC048275 TaxID=3155629 RepID=UPI0033E6B976